jgi:hypothetical protein
MNEDLEKFKGVSFGKEESSRGQLWNLHNKQFFHWDPRGGCSCTQPSIRACSEIQKYLLNMPMEGGDRQIGVSYIRLVVCQHIQMQTLDRSVSSCLINNVDFVVHACRFF